MLLLLSAGVALPSGSRVGCRGSASCCTAAAGFMVRMQTQSASLLLLEGGSKSSQPRLEHWKSARR